MPLRIKNKETPKSLPSTFLILIPYYSTLFIQHQEPVLSENRGFVYLFVCFSHFWNLQADRFGNACIAVRYSLLVPTANQARIHFVILYQSERGLHIVQYRMIAANYLQKSRSYATVML